ncbi:T9SS type A sorting domain-containing protein [Pedobacter aquae]|nr:T9SS type A sorting domain-containing protein [Pedobacter aquae]
MMKYLLTAFLIFFLHSAGKAQCTATITGASSGCFDNISTYSITGATGATSYTWTITGAASFNRVSDTEYTILFGSTNVTITVVPTGGACNGTPVTRTITSAARPVKPVINRAANSNALTTPTVAGLTYQWYFNRTPVSGATTATFPIQNTGLYAVEVTNAAGCKTYSDDFPYFSTSVKEDPKFAGFAYYPNPIEAGNTLTVIFADTYDIELVDMTGKSVLNQKSLKGKQELETSSLNTGIYLMKVESEGKLAFRKIIIN